MSKLLKVYGSYDELEPSYFFTFKFNLLPSEIVFKAPLEESKKNIETVIKTINLEADGFDVILKYWKTEDSSNSDSSQDYPYQYLYKSSKQKCVVFITLDEGILKINILYDCKNKQLEKWALKTNHKLRGKFGLKRTPTFKVLVKHHNFDTEDVRSQETFIDIHKNYNDDFIRINERIKKAISSNESGIILLHGTPGTGKTTYIKSLITEYKNQNFIFVQNEFIRNLLDPDFISFLLKQRNTTLIMEDAEKVIASREKESSVVSTILQLTDGLFSNYLNIKIICTFNTNLSKLDNALLRKGRMIALYEFKSLSIEKTNRLLKEFELEKVQEGLTIADIYNFKESSFENNKKKIGF